MHFATHDWDDDTELSTNVIRAVAAVRNVEATELAPRLNQAVDVDSLDRLFESDGTDAPASSVTVSFRWNGCEVTITEGGVIAVVPPA